MTWKQKEISLPPKSRGFHLITNDIEESLGNELQKIEVGFAHIFLCHTSAAITINENVSRDVWADLEKHLNKIVPENKDYYTHTIEGSDDMPAHIKSSLLGNSLLIPVKSGRLILGTWQGIFLCEHRNNGGSRKLIITICGKANE